MNYVHYYMSQVAPSALSQMIRQMMTLICFMTHRPHNTIQRLPVVTHTTTLTLLQSVLTAELPLKLTCFILLQLFWRCKSPSECCAVHRVHIIR